MELFLEMVTFNAYSSPQRRCPIASLILQKSFVLMNLMKVIQFARRVGSGLAPKDTFLSPRDLPNHTREKPTRCISGVEPSYSIWLGFDLLSSWNQTQPR